MLTSRTYIPCVPPYLSQRVWPQSIFSFLPPAGFALRAAAAIPIALPALPDRHHLHLCKRKKTAEL